MKPSIRAALSCLMRSVKCPQRSRVKAAVARPRTLDRLDIIPGPDGVYGAGVAGVMEADALQASGGGKALEAVFGVPVLQRPAQR